MPNYKTDGLILASYDYKEADKILKIFTRDKGIVSCIAKGIKKATSRKSQYTDIYTYGGFYLAKGKSMDILLEIKPYNDLREDLNPEDINYIFYFAEVLLKSTRDVSYNAGYFDIILKTRSIFKTNKYHSLLRFQLGVLKYLGILPNLRICVKSESSLQSKRYTDNNEIGYNVHDGRLILDRVIKAHIYLSEQNFDNIKKLYLDKAVFEEILSIQNTWIELGLSKRINSYRFIING